MQPLYFAAQGGGNVLIPIIGTFLRFFIAAGAGFIGVRYMDYGLGYLFSCLSVAMVVYELTALASLPFGWGRSAPTGANQIADVIARS